MQRRTGFGKRGDYNKPLFRPPLTPPNLGGETDTQSAGKKGGNYEEAADH